MFPITVMIGPRGIDRAFVVLLGIFLPRILTVHGPDVRRALGDVRQRVGPWINLRSGRPRVAGVLPKLLGQWQRTFHWFFGRCLCPKLIAVADQFGEINGRPIPAESGDSFRSTLANIPHRWRCQSWSANQ